MGFWQLEAGDGLAVLSGLRRREPGEVRLSYFFANNLRPAQQPAGFGAVHSLAGDPPVSSVEASPAVCDSKHAGSTVVSLVFAAGMVVANFRPACWPIIGGGWMIYRRHGLGLPFILLQVVCDCHGVRRTSARSYCRPSLGCGYRGLFRFDDTSALRTERLSDLGGCAAVR